MADSSESERENYNISSSTDEEDLFGTIGRRFQPYQDEPLASSDSEGDGPTSDGNDDPEDEDGIRPSQFRDREAGSAMTNKTVLLQVGPMFKGRDGKPYRRRPGVSEEE
eukprot:gene9811-18381_t